MSRRRVAVLIVSTLIAASCSREVPAPHAAKAGKPAPPDLSTAKVDTTIVPDSALNFAEGSMLGTLLDRNGNVLGDKTTFRKGDRIALTLRFRESPSGLRATAVFGEQFGKDLVTQQKDMNGAKVVTFVLDKGLPPGKYRVTGYWGGNVAAEREFQVTK
jgi:hypothetical protein